MRLLTASLVVLVMSALGCRAAGTPVSPGAAPAQLHTAAPGGREPLPGPFIPPEMTAPERRVWAYVDEARRVMDIDDARSAGLTILDLSDDWVPYIFWSQTPGKEDYMANAFLDTYVDLANDRIDVDGVDLSPGEHNYLELYGIPPSLGVLRQRLISEEGRECFKKIEYSVFSEYLGSVRIGDPESSERELSRYHSVRAAFKKAQKEARARSLERMLALPRYRRLAERYQRAHWRHQVIREMQRRLQCEEILGSKVKVKPGIVTWAVREALRDYERKHNVYGWGLLFENTVKALGRTTLQNNFETFKRILAERIISALRIVEDGTVEQASYRSRSGASARVRNLVEELTQAALEQMGLETPERVLAFMKQHNAKDFERMYVALRLPPLPEYYSDNMDLEVVIDRGDVWYDLPFDEKGRPVDQPRSVYPYLTLYVRYAEQKIPLVRWRTTIGGWQAEMRHDQEYYKYKISDVGARIWRHIVAGPVWVPPPSTPSRDMVKLRNVRNNPQPIVSHMSFGPGYASAYGLAAAFHVTPENRDNQVRTHGSVNYMSIVSSKGFSHGCHRIFNHRAVRLFSFILGHRPFKRLGQTRLAYQHRFEHRGEEFQMDLWTRGYYYELTPPLPVNVLEGNIKGETKDPIEEYIKKPSLVYQDDLPSLKQKVPAGAPRMDKRRKGGMMRQPQNL